MRLSQASAVVVMLGPSALGAQPSIKGSPYGDLVRASQPEFFDPTYVVDFRLFLAGSRQAIENAVAGASLKSPADLDDQTSSIFRRR